MNLFDLDETAGKTRPHNLIWKSFGEGIHYLVLVGFAASPVDFPEQTYSEWMLFLNRSAILSHSFHSKLFATFSENAFIWLRQTVCKRSTEKYQRIAVTICMYWIGSSVCHCLTFRYTAASSHSTHYTQAWRMFARTCESIIWLLFAYRRTARAGSATYF